MKFCRNCGTPLGEGQVCSCTYSATGGKGFNVEETVRKVDKQAAINAFAAAKNRMGIGDTERNETDVYERGMDIIPDCIAADENEIPVKQYNIAVLRNLLRFERAEGRVQVTNKRVVFRACGRSLAGRTTLQHEFSMAEIAGIEAKRNYKFSFLHLLFAMIISGLALFIIYGNFLGGGAPQIFFRMHNPSHLYEARMNESAAISERGQAERRADAVIADLNWAEEQEERMREDVNWLREREREAQFAFEALEEGVEEWIWEGYAQAWRDAIEWREFAEEDVRRVAERREQAEAEAELATLELEEAEDAARVATQRRERAETIWRGLMVLFGLTVGVGAMLPFFLVYKRFGLKLFLLNFSVFGFMFANLAWPNLIFTLLVLLSVLVTFACIVLFCFRPNLVLCVKNKAGLSEAVSIRRDNFISRRAETGTGFGEVMPTEESERAIREIGAIIHDIQTLGDLGVKKWTE